MNKLFTKLLLVITLLVASLSDAHSEEKQFKSSLGINGNISTLGVGGDIYWHFMPRLSVRVGYNRMSFKANFDFDQDNLSLSAKTKYLTSGISVGVDYQFIGFMYVTGGVGVFNFKPQGEVIPSSGLDFGDITLTPEAIGSATIKIKNQYSAAPYLGIGFGKLTPKGNVSFAFELGAYYMGRPQITIDATGMLAPSADPEHAQLLSNQISDYKLYPVIKFSLGVKLFTFKK